MKYWSSTKATLTVLAAGALLWVAPASAQDGKTRFDIPFQFVAGSEVLPAGQYEVTMDPATRVILRSTREGTSHVVALIAKYQTRHTADLTKGMLRFQQVDGTMYLSAAWGRNQADARTVAPSKRSAEALNAARNGGNPVTLDVN